METITGHIKKNYPNKENINAHCSASSEKRLTILAQKLFFKSKN